MTVKEAEHNKIISRSGFMCIKLCSDGHAIMQFKPIKCAVKIQNIPLRIYNIKHKNNSQSQKIAIKI